MGNVELIHGDGGKATNEIIENIFYKSFKNNILLEKTDSARFKVNKGTLAFTTDSFVVNPIFFRGGNIGELSICGTVNDLVACGAKPLYLSTGFIIEEGFPMEDLQKIATSMASMCHKVGAKIVTGDTKVVEKGKVDGVFINTAGIGIIEKYAPKKIENGDEIIITGGIAEHGTAIAVDRYKLNVKGDIKSDCQPLNYILEFLPDYEEHIKFMRDPTRGGLVEILNEISEESGLGVQLIEDDIPIRDEVKSINEMLGLDPLYLASEGRMVIVVKKGVAKSIVNRLNNIYGCKGASIIGNFTNREGFVYIKNTFGGKRILNVLDSQMLPRIC